MKDKFLFAFTTSVGIEFLGIFACAERRERYRLRFAAAEHRRTVRPWQNANLAPDGADLIESPAIEALGLIHDQSAHRFLLDVIERVLEDELGDFFGPKFFNELRANFIGDRLDC